MARQPSTTPIVFVVPGQRQTLRSGSAPQGAGQTGLSGQLKDSVRLSARRAGSESVRVTAIPGEDVVLLQIAGGPPLLLHPENARDLLLGRSGTTRSAAQRRPTVTCRWRCRCRCNCAGSPGAGCAHAHARLPGRCRAFGLPGASPG